MRRCKPQRRRNKHNRFRMQPGQTIISTLSVLASGIANDEKDRHIGDRSEVVTKWIMKPDGDVAMIEIDCDEGKRLTAHFVRVKRSEL